MFAIVVVHPVLYTGKELSKRQFVALLKLRYKQIIRNKGKDEVSSIYLVNILIRYFSKIKFISLNIC